jgi:hypothetical protein
VRDLDRHMDAPGHGGGARRHQKGGHFRQLKRAADGG